MEQYKYIAEINLALLGMSLLITAVLIICKYGFFQAGNELETKYLKSALWTKVCSDVALGLAFVLPDMEDVVWLGSILGCVAYLLDFLFAVLVIFYMIYCVEDEKNIRELLIYTLETTGFSARGMANSKELKDALKEELPDLILLDIMLPDEDGIEILKKLRASGETKKIPVILVTAKSTELDKVKGLDIGADDYITKPFGVMELISRVRALIRRSMDTGADKSIRVGNIFLDSDRHIVYVDDEPKELTFKEYELLRCLMNNSGVAMHRDRIMELVWGVDFEGESRTLDMHIKTLRKKLGEAGSMIKTVRNVGYIMSDKEN